MTQGDLIRELSETCDRLTSEVREIRQKCEEAALAYKASIEMREAIYDLQQDVRKLRAQFGHRPREPLYVPSDNPVAQPA